MKGILGIFLSTLLGLVNSYQELTLPKYATIEMFPYHAIIQADERLFGGALISENFVLTFAHTIIDAKKVVVHLGYIRNAHHYVNKYSNGQTCEPEQIYVHEYFGYLGPKKHAINNFALIKLKKNIKITSTVKPIPIASPDDFPIPPGTFINTTGFPNLDEDSDRLYATVQERNPDLCKVFYGSSFLESYEGCVRHKDDKRMRLIGPYVVNGIMIGLERRREIHDECRFSAPHCVANDVYMSLEPALAWIYQISGVAGVNGKKIFEEVNSLWN